MNEDLRLKFEEEEKMEKLLTILNGGKPIKQKGERTKNMIVRDIFTGHLHDVEHDRDSKKYYVKTPSGSIHQIYFEHDFESVFVSPWTRKYVIERECE